MSLPTLESNRLEVAPCLPTGRNFLSRPFCFSVGNMFHGIYHIKRDAYNADGQFDNDLKIVVLEKKMDPY
jgi:hypothetical protein